MVKNILQALFLFILLNTSSVFAATYTVTTNADSGPGSLRDAISFATNGDLINFSIGTATITLTSDLPQLASGVTIDGGATANTGAVFGSANNSTFYITITSNAATHLINIGSSNNCTIRGLILLNVAPTATGSLIYITSGDNNQILGCLIGTSGLIAGASNALYGVYLGAGASNNAIGNGTAAGANVISGIGNYGYGIYMTGTGTNGNTVRGNIIGLRKDGATLVTGGNYQKYGVCMTDRAIGNTIGGTGAGDGNVISGQYGQYGPGTKHYGVGILITSTHSPGNTVIGNRIGMQSNGTTIVTGNTQYIGIEILNSPSNTIGGNTAAHRNVISGNGPIPSQGASQINATGILVIGGMSAGNVIKGNYIGMQSNGTTFMASAEQYKGIVFRSAGANTVGGSAAGEGNVISGNTCHFAANNCGEGRGIVVKNTSSLTIAGNIIGLQANGTALLISSPVEQQYWGIEIDSASANNIIGGNNPFARNVISGNTNSGIRIGFLNSAGCTGNIIKGNYIGLQSDGITIVAGNAQRYGVYITDLASSNTIGGTTYNERNVISGNEFFGIYLLDGTTFNTISGNIIGLTKNGTPVASNTQTRGIQFQNAANNNTIGGNTVGQRNYISGNSNCGILFIANNGVTANSTGNVIKGNYVGTDTTGTSYVSNQATGIYIGNTGVSNVIGGTGAGERNIISGNVTGIYNNANSNLIIGNIIGPQANGTAALISNSQSFGLHIDNASNTIVGGVLAAARNVISANLSDGLIITGAASTGTIAKGNYLGPGSSLAAIAGSTQMYGLHIYNSANNNTIGGVLAGEANIMAYNTTNGSLVAGSATNQNKISGSPHYSNTGKPIELNYGINGGNNNKPIPVILVASTTTISGTSAVGDVVEVFKNTTGNCYDAVTYLGAATANASGVWSLSVASSTGDYVLATARDASNNTSEFTPCNAICPPVYTTQNITICSNDSFTLPGGSSVNTAGAYIDTLTTAGGCDSIITTNLTVKPISTTIQNITMCYGDSVLVGATYYYSTGNFIDTLVAANGCDSIITTNLIESPLISTTQTITMCFGDSVLVGSTYYYSTGNFIDTLIALNGCDSVVTTNLTESPLIATTQTLTICFGDSVLVGNTYYYNTGNYTNTLTAANGCDSIVTTNITESPLIATSQSFTICFGDSILVGNTYYYNTGVYTTPLIAANGCDSIVTTTITESPLIATSQTFTICFGDSILVGSTYYYNTGIYTTPLIAANGCDSIVTTTITESPLIATTQTLSMCFGDSVLVGNTYYYNSGNYTNTLTASNGCDSIVTTNLTERPLIATTQTITICFGDSVLVGGTYYYNSGNYTNTLTAANGCDSIVTTNLTERPLISTTQTLTICFGDSVLVGSTYYYNTGNYSNTLTAANGCDSIVTTSITERPLIATTQTLTICFGDSVLVGNTYYYNTGNYTNTLTAANGCDSIVTTNITESPLIATSQSFTMCFGDSILVGTTYYYNTGVYTTPLIAANGCDSIVTTNIIERPLNTTTQNINLLCQGQTFTLPGGSVVGTPGTYTDILVASNGCDSVVVTILTISPAPSASFVATPPAGTAPATINFTNTSQNSNTYLWQFGTGDTSTAVNPSYLYNTPGVYTVCLIASNGSTCYDTACADINIFESYDVSLPNVFTPNGDGTNDYLTINWEGVESIIGEIYDRWGLKLYEWKTLTGGWDGYTSSGSPASDGTYYFIIKATDFLGEVHLVKGAFTLIR